MLRNKVCLFIHLFVCPPVSQCSKSSKYTQIAMLLVYIIYEIIIIVHLRIYAKGFGNSSEYEQELVDCILHGCL